MKARFLPHGRALRTALLALLLCVAGTAKLHAQSGNISFTDDNVKLLCVATETGWDTNGDGELSYEEAAAVTDLGEVFSWDQYITSFNELQYFTGLDTIGSIAFVMCESLTAITLPQQLTTIENYAFENCRELKSIAIPANVTSISTTAFAGCENLETITVAEGNTVYDSRNNCNAIIETATNTLIAGCFNTIIPDNVTAIGDYAFADQHRLEVINIPAAVTTIGKNAFFSCWSMQEVNFAENSTLTTIGEAAFYSCYLSSLTIPSQVTSIGNSAFSGNYYLQSLDLKAEVPPTLGSYAFQSVPTDITVTTPSCNSLAAYMMAEGWSEFTNYVKDGCNIVFADEQVKLICVGKWDGIDDGNKDGELSYAEAAKVYDLELAFRNNRLIESFNELKHFTGLLELNTDEFSDCPTLTSIIIPKNVQTIGDHIFAGCDNLVQLKVDPENQTFDSRDDCNAIIESYSGTLIAGCSATVIPNTVNSIGNYAFYSIKSLTSMDIPESVTSIGESAFAFCQGLTSITFPPYLDGIDMGAFSNCVNLASITVEAQTPPNLYGDDVFQDVPTNILVTVPCACLGAYQMADGWKDFTNMIEDRCPYVVHNGGKWSQLSTWSQGGQAVTTLPSAEDDVIINAACEMDMIAEVASLSIADYAGITITADGFLTVTGNMDMEENSYINIHDGGQLIHSVDYIYANVNKRPVAYSNANVSDSWNLIASPIYGWVETNSVVNLLDHEYDLYYYDEPTRLWLNEKNPSNSFEYLIDSKGYLYAVNTDVELGFSGYIRNGTASYRQWLSYTEEAGRLKGFNLVGNPFVHNVTTYARYNVAEEVYRLNDNRDELIPGYINAENPLKPCEGFFVKAEQDYAYITFNARSGGERESAGHINLELSANGKLIDRLIVKDRGNALEKLTLKDNGTKIFAVRNSQEMAVVPSEGNEQAVSFKAAQNGTYTLSVNVEGMDLSYLHLIDNMTGADVDLLATATGYTFNAKTTDYESRFRLVFSINGIDENALSANFAYYNGSEWVINASAGATVQVVDMMGRVVLSTDVARNVSTKGMAPGVYVLRLIDGKDVKTQKIVID